jgi:branched-chain amino acid transport system ATP-binding protein
VPALRAEAITVRFGGTRALDETSIAVESGRITGLIGPNGAGKTTLFNVVTGLLRPDTGRVWLAGQDVTRLSPHRRAQRGLARTFQRLELFTSLSVRDNIRVAGDIRNAWLPSRSKARLDVAEDAERVLELTGLAPIADREVSEIPTGQARVVELARALMTRPTVLLLDEPAAGQTEDETLAFGGLLRRLASDGLGVCLVEHDMTLVMDVCETITVLDYGRTIAEGTPDEIRGDQAVVDAYLGTPEGVA